MLRDSLDCDVCSLCSLHLQNLAGLANYIVCVYQRCYDIHGFSRDLCFFFPLDWCRPAPAMKLGQLFINF